MTDEMIIKNAYEVIEACANFSNSTLNFCNSVSGILSAMDRGALQAASMTGPGLPGYGGNNGLLNPIRYSGVSQCARSVTKLQNLARALTPIVSTGFSNLTGYDQDIVDQILGKKSSGHNYVKDVIDYGGILSDATTLAGDIAGNDWLTDKGTVIGTSLEIVGEIKDQDYTGVAISALGYVALETIKEDASMTFFADPALRIAKKWNDDLRDPTMDWKRTAEEMLGEVVVVAGVTLIAATTVALLAPATATAGAVVAAAGFVASGIYIAGNLIDKLWGSGDGDMIESLSDGLISVGEKLGETLDNAAKEVGNAIQSGWNTFCSWFS